ILAEIETDKATMEFESFHEGTLLHIGVQEGETTKVDELLAIIGEEGENISDLLKGGSSKEKKDDKEAPKSDTEAEKEKQESKDKDDSDDKKEQKESKDKDNSDDKNESSASLPEGVVVVTMPRLSDTMEEGTVATWLKKVGDSVEEGDILAEIETDR